MYASAYKGEELQRFGLTKAGYRLEGQFNPTKNMSSKLDLKKVFDMVTHDIHELLHNVLVSTMDSNQSEFYEDFSNGTKKNETSHIEVTTKYQSNLGKCFSIRPKPNIIKLGVVSIEFVAKMGIYVYLGHPGQFNYNTKTKVFGRETEYSCFILAIYGLKIILYSSTHYYTV